MSYTGEIEIIDRSNYDLQEDDTSGDKHFATFTRFEEYIDGLEDEIETKEIGEIIDKKITITTRPNFVITMNAIPRVELLSTQTSRFLSTWVDLRFKITKDGIEVAKYRMDVFQRSYDKHGNKGPIDVSPLKLVKMVETLTHSTFS